MIRFKNELDLIKDAREKFCQLSKSFNFGDSPDEEYADELMSTYYETLPMNSRARRESKVNDS